jgi:hypothetical protein
MSGLPFSDKEKVDREEAAHLIFYARDVLVRLGELEDQPQMQRNLLAVMGYPPVSNDREYRMVVRTIKRVAYPSRSRGIH